MIISFVSYSVSIANLESNRVPPISHVTRRWQVVKASLSCDVEGFEGPMVPHPSAKNTFDGNAQKIAPFSKVNVGKRRVFKLYFFK